MHGAGLMALGPEDLLQITVVRFLRVAAPGLLYWHVPNGGARSPGEGRKFKDMGTLPGVADLSFVLPDGRAAFIELKTLKGRQEPTQKAFEEACQNNNAPYAVCRSLKEVEATLTGWGIKLRARSCE